MRFQMLGVLAASRILTVCWCLAIQEGTSKSSSLYVDSLSLDPVVSTSCIRVFAWLLACLLVCLFACLFVLFDCLFACLLVCLFVCLFVCVCDCFFVWLFACQFVCLIVCV